MAAAIPPDAQLTGRVVSHYRILKEIGRGGMGVVYQARDLELERLVAMKVLPHDLASDPDRLRRFKQEARTVAALSHPNIVTVFSVEEADDLRFMTMELVDGPSLGQLLDRGPLALPRLLALGIPLADALAAAHRAGVLHRDLKPANILIAPGDHPKILDFGLAKMQPSSVAGEVGEAPTEAATQAGTLMGTIPYMAPEQLQGQPADERSDIFSLGIVVHQMATGKHPFPGSTSLEVVSSILRDLPAAVSDAAPELPAEIDHILGRCLEKRPESRIQSATELHHQLAALKLQLSGSQLSIPAPQTPVVQRPAARKPLLFAAAVLLLLVLSSVAIVLNRRQATPPPESVAATASRQSIAVLFFHNLSGEPELDWLQRGITDMLITDLSQAGGLEVLSSDRLHHLLKELDQLEEATLAPAIVGQLAERADVGMMLLGSFAMVGERIRIIVQLQDSANGAILGASHVEGMADNEIFSLIDQLGEQIRQHLNIALRSAGDPHLEDVSTSSLEAYRNYVEGTELLRQVKLPEAIPLFKRALEIDPRFAMAFVRLATVYETLGQAGEAAQYHAKAFEHSARLPAAERLYIQGRYYDAKWETLPQAITYLESAVEADPDHYSARHHLTKLFGFVERYEDAIVSNEAVRDRGFPGASSHALASMYASLDRFDEGHRLLEEFLQNEPDSWVGELAMGWNLAHWGKLEEAFASYRRAESLRPGDPFIAIGRYRATVMAQRWEEAVAVAQPLADSPDPYLRWRGHVDLARVNLYRGRLDEALPLFRAAAAAYPQGGGFAAAARCWAAEALLQAGRADDALAEAEAAGALAPGEWPEREALFWAARAAAVLGREDSSQALTEQLRQKVSGSSTVVDRRLLQHLLGQVALAAGDTAAAVSALRAAEELLPPRGIPWHWHRTPDTVMIWFALAAAYELEGDLDQAAALYQRIVDSTVEHLEVPIPYILSIYRLADIHRRRGDTSQAAAHFRRFLGFWQDGELFRGEVEMAKTALESG